MQKVIVYCSEKSSFKEGDLKAVEQAVRARHLELHGENHQSNDEDSPNYRLDEVQFPYPSPAYNLVESADNANVVLCNEDEESGYKRQGVKVVSFPKEGEEWERFRFLKEEVEEFLNYN